MEIKNTHQSILTKQEELILQSVAQGNSNKQIAQALFISTQTIKTHLRNIYKKLAVKNKIQALNKWDKRA